MAYQLSQYNKGSGPDIGFMTLVTEGDPITKSAPSGSGDTGDADRFKDEGVYVSSGLSASKHYYFHCKIRKMNSAQEFDIKLINFNSTDNAEQYLKTITVAGGSITEWVDFEFIFTPFVRFDTILFKLKRTEEDYTGQARKPVISYEELSEINNIIVDNRFLGVSSGELLKLGIQSRPSLMMCINGEEIRSYRSGIYELKDGSVIVNFFSVVNAAENVNPIDYSTITTSRCFFNVAKTRIIDGFTLDYLYES